MSLRVMTHRHCLPHCKIFSHNPPCTPTLAHIALHPQGTIIFFHLMMTHCNSGFTLVIYLPVTSDVWINTRPRSLPSPRPPGPASALRLCEYHQHQSCFNSRALVTDLISLGRQRIRRHLLQSSSEQRRPQPGIPALSVWPLNMGYYRKYD